MSTFSFAKEPELEGQLRDRPRGEEIRIGDEKFFASSLALEFGAQPALSLTVLKSYDEATASLKRLNRLLLGLGLAAVLDRKSTRLNSSHGSISYAVFCLKKKIVVGNNIYLSHVAASVRY